MSNVFRSEDLKGLLNDDCAFILDKIWTAMSRPNQRYNPLFNLFFPTDGDLHDTAGETKFRVSNGLIDKMTADSPPDPEFWKTLPRRVPKDKSWGDYVVHMEKEGERPRDYFGSATSEDGGFDTRLPVYDYPLNLSALPKYVAQAVSEGYRITHVGILISGPKPAPAQIPTFRLFYVAAEATLAMWFWAFNYRDKNHPDLECCAWDLDAFQYDGVCSHSAFKEGIRGNFELTAEELEAVAATRAERHRQDRLEDYHKSVEADPYAVREDQRDAAARRRERSPERQAAKRKKNNDALYARNPGLKQAYKETYAKRVRLSKKYYCDACGTDSESEANFKKHLATSTHKKAIIRVAEGRQLQHRYYHCYVSYDTKGQLNKHCTRVGHKENASAPDAATAAKAAREKAIRDNPGAILAAKAAISACNGDYSKAITKFNTEIDPVPDEAPEIYDLKGLMPPKSVSQDTVQRPPVDNSPKWGVKKAKGSTSSKTTTSSKLHSVAETQSLFEKREYKLGRQSKLTFGGSTKKQVSGEK
jgi:hypothetical protein